MSDPSTQPNATNPAQSVLPDKLRIDFVGMAFALAIGEVGLQIGKLYEAEIKLRDHIYLFGHIFLPIYIIASSWIGWQLSPSKGNHEKLKDAFSIQFIILLLDLLLVICYFIVVQCIGKDPLKPSCYNQIYWSEFIFCVYIVWDFFSKIIVPNDLTNGTRFIKKNELKDYFLRCYQAPICLVVIFFFIRPLKHETCDRGVLYVDLLLISVFMLFRGMKSFGHQRKNIPLYILMPAILFICIYSIYKFAT